MKSQNIFSEIEHGSTIPDNFSAGENQFLQKRLQRMLEAHRNQESIQNQGNQQSQALNAKYSSIDDYIKVDPMVQLMNQGFIKIREAGFHMPCS